MTAAERAVAKAEEQMYDLEQQIQEAAADYLKLQELYEQREALEEEILKLYGTWETLSAQLEEALGFVENSLVRNWHRENVPMPIGASAASPGGRPWPPWCWPEFWCLPGCSAR